MSKGTQVATRKGSALAVADEENPLTVVDYGLDAGAGFEDMGRDDFATPFLYVLQPNSPIVTIDDNARPGMLMNTISGEIYPAEKIKEGHNGISFVPCFRQHQLIEWKKRDEKGGGGGFVGTHEVGGVAEAWAKANCKFGEWETQDGNDLIDTFYVYGLIVKPDGNWEQAVIPFTSTKIKAYKHWMTRMKMIRVPTPAGGSVEPPIYAHRWRLTTKREQNDQGVYYILEIGFDGANAIEARLDPNSEVFREARTFYELCRDGIAKPNYTAPATHEAVAGSGADSEVPF